MWVWSADVAGTISSIRVLMMEMESVFETLLDLNHLTHLSV
jgi:hypothetical protein